jgi:hypothetical protein
VMQLTCDSVPEKCQLSCDKRDEAGFRELVSTCVSVWLL